MLASIDDAVICVTLELVNLSQSQLDRTKTKTNSTWGFYIITHQIPWELRTGAGSLLWLVFSPIFCCNSGSFTPLNKFTVLAVTASSGKWFHSAITL